MGSMKTMKETMTTVTGAINSATGAINSANENAFQGVRTAVDTAVATTDALHDKVDTAAGDLVTRANSAVSAVTDKMKALSDSMSESEERWPQLNNINLREKLRFKCPNFWEISSSAEVDFGNLFLNTPRAESIASKVSDKVSKGISAYNGLTSWMSADTLVAATDLVTFLVDDITREVLGYVTSRFNHYASAEYVIGLGQQLAESTVVYTKENTKDPRELLAAYKQDPDEELDKKLKENKAALLNTIKENASEDMAKVTSWVKDAVKEIKPYIPMIQQYMAYGPDYAVQQIEMIYKDYLIAGFSYCDSILNKFNIKVDKSIDTAAKSMGMWAARQINKATEDVLVEAYKYAESKKVAIINKAKSMANATLMELMAKLGG